MAAYQDDHSQLVLKGVRENNLQNLNLSLEHNKLVAITGVSGSGKSTLAFDTIYAEGGRRYIETFSPYTRQFLQRLHQPDVDSIHGLRPALALEQRNKTTASRSTVGTITEINDYLKILWSELGTIHCNVCKAPVHRDTPAQVIETLKERVPEIAAVDYFALCFRVTTSGASTAESLRHTLQAEGFIRFYNETTNTVESIDTLSDKNLQKGITVVVDRIRLDAEERQGNFSSRTCSRLTSSITQAYQYGHSHLQVLILSDKMRPTALDFYDSLVCRSCGAQFDAPRPALFSFNSPLGACDTCHGFGKILAVDEELCIPNPQKTLREGAIACWEMPSTKRFYRKLVTFCEKKSIDLDTPWEKLSQTHRNLIFQGSSKDKFRGIEGWYKRLERKKYKMHVRVFLSYFRGEFLCPACHGTRLRPQALFYEVNALTIADIWRMPVQDALGFFVELKSSLTDKLPTDVVLDEVIARLRYICDIGLGYLTLDRQSRTLSGGEFQRINLTAILGSRLVSTLLVLDEPTIGLHPRDNDRLVTALKNLCDRGNSVLLVEHDPRVISHADEVVDLGPGAGSSGGTVVYQGPLSGISSAPQSLTGKYLSNQLRPARSRHETVTAKTKRLSCLGCSAHNLKDIDVHIPLGKLVVLTGVSGSGKSSFVSECLYNTYEKILKGRASARAQNADGPLRELRGLEHLDEIVLIDQSPVGKTPRSNPATYTKAWDVVREALANTPDAQKLSLGKSAFSFNVDGGRCPDCKGAGYHRIEMQFLADVFVECETCAGVRFKDQVLGVTLGGKNVIELLTLSIADAVKLFQELEDKTAAEKFLEFVKPLCDLGLDYLRLGQPLNQLSGGEAQRLKLASYLNSTERKQCLFILDEPTTGLHPHNISQLLKTFDELLSRGHSLLVIEHNLDVVREADWIIDLGPEGGDAGGEIVVEGAPAQLIARGSSKSHTVKALINQTSSSLEGNASSLLQPKERVRAEQRRSVALQRPAIQVTNARHHNLKNVSVKIPHGSFTVVTGVSGSGKSTLAFDIIFSEGQRRYIDCLSPYARQFIKQLERPDVDFVDSLPPTVALSQKTAPPLGVSTVATTTEIYQYLRLLFSKAATQHCPEHDIPIVSSSAENITDEIIRQYANKRVFLLAPVVSGRKGHYNELFNRALRAELVEARIDGVVRSLSPDLRLDRNKLHWVSLLVGSVGKPSQNRELIKLAVEQCLLLGDNVVEVVAGEKDAEPELFSTARVCPKCNRGFRALDPQDFSFRSKRGMCKRCEGHGKIFKNESDLTGSKCPDCDGTRIAPLGRHVYFHGKTIFALSALTAPNLRAFLEAADFPQRLLPIVRPILRELVHKLEVIERVGLGYLALDRESSTISGGEAQRLRLARALGSPLTGLCYVLDEPTIGLHSQDHAQLMETLIALRDQGNTLIVVEHDEDTIRAADYVIDVGPTGGAQGGHILSAGTLDDLLATETSLTAHALRERSDKARMEKILNHQVTKRGPLLKLTGATTNNLKQVSATFPLGKLTVVAGVSGAGKSSLINHTLIPALTAALVEQKKSKRETESQTWKELKGQEELDRLVLIDQSPVGKTSASTPASFLGIFDDVRKLYASLPEAQARGWSNSHFSFNSGKGRCPNCEGKGYLKVPMSFLPDAVSTCEQCQGKRYNEQTLEIYYQGISIGDLLQKTIAEAKEILTNHRRIRHTLDHVVRLGIGYLTLGQPTHTLSGGELQRLKIARELGARLSAAKTLYVIDEPTTGLHMTDVDKLMNVVKNLTDANNTVVIIEHNLDVIAEADHLIEVGPGPGEAGGRVVFQGSPAELVGGSINTPTKKFLLLPETSSGTPKQKSASAHGNDEALPSRRDRAIANS